MAREALPADAWQQVKELFSRAVELEPAARAQFLKQATAEQRLRDEVAALLASHESADGFLEPDSHSIEPGTMLGRYQIERSIASGGMGDVYRATDQLLDRDVAVKVVRDGLDASHHDAFESEARAIAALSHPNILSVFDVGFAGGKAFLVTELLEGETLRARLERRRPSVKQALEWAAMIAAGLSAAHEKRIVHRDLKPENIFVLRDNSIKILDFGLAQRVDLDSETETSQTGRIAGTAGYLAPEQARGEAVGPAADLFALGAILHEMLTGARAFRGDTILETLSHVVNLELDPPSTVRSSIPAWVDAVVARALAKDVASRCESARDFAFAIEFGEMVGEPLRRRRRVWPVAVACVIAVAIGAVTVPMLSNPLVPARAELRAAPTRTRTLTNSGRDQAPTISSDGRFLVFVSDRDGQSRLWLQQLESGRERPLTDGPDSAPRFSPDDSQVLFTRATRKGTSLYRVDLLGGAPRKIADDASDADWSPDGSEVVFVRWVAKTAQARPWLMVCGVDGSNPRKLAELDNRVELRPRWSPDGEWIAVTGVVQQPGAHQSIVLFSRDGSQRRRLRPPKAVGLISAVSWEGTSALLYSQAVSVLGNSAGSPAQLVRQSIEGGAPETLLWTRESSSVVERRDDTSVILDARSASQNLRDISLSTGEHRYLSRGTATDRQPVLSPDGRLVAFSSSRSGNLDIWVVDRRSGETRRLTDDDGDDWDPAFTPDGRSLLWSSNRSGHFEVWIADLDGSNARQLTRDGYDAENPTATADGQWVVYSSGAPERKGVWKIRLDGSDATRLVADVILPQVSPDGSLVLFQTNRSPRQAVVGVARVSDGAVLPFHIEIDIHKPSRARSGRGRWWPDGKSIAFVGQDRNGNVGIYRQAFEPEGETSRTRRPVAGFDADRITESFDLDGEHIVVAEWEQRHEIVLATGSDLRR